MDAAPPIAARAAAGRRPAFKRLALRGGANVDLSSYRVLVDSLYASPSAFVMSNVVGTSMPAFCFYVTADPVFGWMTGLGAALACLRLVFSALYLSHGAAPMTRPALRAWDRRYCYAATAFSLLLGFTTFAALTRTQDDACHLLTVGCSLAFAAAFVARNAGRPAFVIVQVACFSIPTALGLLIANEPYYGFLAAFITASGLANVTIVFTLNRNLLQLAAARTRSEQLAASVQRQNATLDSALNSMTHGLCMFDADMRLEVSNRRFLELFGLSSHDVASGTDLDGVCAGIRRSHVLSPQSVADLAELCRRAALHGQPLEREILAESGQVYVLFAELTATGGILLLTEDATARKAAAAQIERMAHSDTLTGLPNRFRFGELLKAALAARVEGGLRQALLYIDLDNFKVVNDSLGHEFGDLLLVKVAERLTAVCGDGGVVGRFGGDEFLVLFDIETEQDALGLARRIIAELAQPVDLSARVVTVTTSIGVAIGPDHGHESGELLRSADMALYAAKGEGKNTAVLYTPAIAAALSHRREMEADLRTATRTGRLFLHYQPIVDARTGHLRSYEALMRWSHPEKGVISPAEFIPIAEQTGLIVQMGAWALRQACMDARRWPERVAVAVNVSAFQFKQAAQLVETVKDALLISGLNPSRLEIEVTESLLIADQEATLDAIRTLRRLGVKFSLDDFGSGYSSLGYLARYPFSKVKIDRSFAQHLSSDSPSRSIIEVVCQLATKLDMKVVVEGIETEAQRREIVSLGAEQAQGWLFGRPCALDQLSTQFQDAA